MPSAFWQFGRLSALQLKGSIGLGGASGLEAIARHIQRNSCQRSIERTLLCLNKTTPWQITMAKAVSVGKPTVKMCVFLAPRKAPCKFRQGQSRQELGFWELLGALALGYSTSGGLSAALRRDVVQMVQFWACFAAAVLGAAFCRTDLGAAFFA